MIENLDAEIRAVEVRLARERNELVGLLEDWGSAARDAVATPKNLFAVAALGFVLGEASRPRRPESKAPRRSVGGLIAGAAFALVRARYGSPLALFRQFWSQAPRRSARTAWRPTHGIETDARTGLPSDLPQRAAG